jgi:hypothetical protein
MFPGSIYPNAAVVSLINAQKIAEDLAPLGRIMGEHAVLPMLQVRAGANPQAAVSIRQGR